MLVAGWQHNVRFIPVFTWDTVTCWLLVGNTMYVLYLYSRGILLHVGFIFKLCDFTKTILEVK